MQATISKWGNSLALRLPRHIADLAHLGEGATVHVEVGADGTIKLTPTRKKFNLSDLLDGHPKPTSTVETREVDWATARGDEAW